MLAKYFTNDVFPADVGPSNKTGRSEEEMARNKSTICFLKL